MTGYIKNRIHFLRALLSIAYFGYPARKLTVIGVTGTDGKTTTATLIYQILKTAGKKVASITTVAAYMGDKEIDTGFHVTTPDTWKLQKLTKEITRKGYKYLVLEATSHGLDQHRVLGANIKIAVVTNVTHEHLDYHKTYQKYLASKAKIFRRAKVAILNKSHYSYSKLKKYLKSETKLVDYDLDSLTGHEKKSVEKKFSENYNRLNATAAVLAAKEVGIEEKVIVKAINTFPGVPGRMEYIKNKKGIDVIIDFAHTPNALENVLRTLGGKKKGRLIVIFGCAGERDKLKRPKMGRISVKLADISVFTAEDPRGEDINDIIDEIVRGAKKEGAIELTHRRINELIHESKNKVFLRIPERGEAIAFAIQKVARRGDIVVICGKGHEKSMAYGKIEYPWSDKKAIEGALKGGILEIKR